MSYILDALKKLEHEKSRKTRGNGMINISGALFEHERPQPSGTAGWKIALTVTIAVLVTFGVTWLLLRPAKGREKVVQRIAPPVAGETVPPPPALPVVPVQETPPAAPPAPATAAPVRSPAHASKPQKAVVQAAVTTDDAAAEPTLQESRTRTKERKVQAAPAQTIAAPADIKLSGIAWQEERRARRAVVNGFLMQEGGIVSGARITDIYQERVRFSLSGKIFEIPLVSSAVSAAGK